MYRFYLPTYYMLYSRPKSASALASGLIIITIPLVFMAWYFSALGMLELLLLFYLSRLAFMLIYETGYMENDIVTIKKEATPTIRLKPQDFVFFDKHYWPVVISKVALAALILGLLLALRPWWNAEIYVGQFLACMVVMRLFFFAHNTFRGRMNILTEGGLIAVKYPSFLFLVIPWQEMPLPYLLAFFAFPLVRIIEYAQQEKFRLPGLTSAVDYIEVFRVKYYGILLAISALAYGLFPGPISQMYLILICYFFAYRFGLFLLNYKNWHRKKVL